MPEVPEGDRLSLPKIDLHRHLDGAIRTGTILDLGRQQNVELPADTPSELEKHVTVPHDCRNLSEFLGCFETLYPVIQSPVAVERIAYELCEDLSNENVLYAEVRFAPVLLTESGHSQEEIVAATLSGLDRGRSDFETEVNLILCFYRGTGLEASLETLDVALEYRDAGIVGLDLAGDESRYSAEAHREAFRLAGEEEFNLTIHAGEAGPAKNVREALNLGADRIGHGVNAVEDQSLMEHLADREIPLEICYTSNLHTQAVSDLNEHPLPEFVERGLKVTINTDDPRISRTTINEEFRKITRAFDFDRQDLIEFLHNAADASFADEERTAWMKREISVNDRTVEGETRD